MRTQRIYDIDIKKKYENDISQQSDDILLMIYLKNIKINLLQVKVRH